MRRDNQTRQNGGSVKRLVSCEQVKVWRDAQWRPRFFLKSLLKAFLLRLPDDSPSSPVSSSTPPFLVGTWSPVPRALPDELEEVDDEKTAVPSVASDVMQRERVEQAEARTVAEMPLSSPRLELFSRPPPPPRVPSLKPGSCSGWSLDGRRKDFELC